MGKLQNSLIWENRDMIILLIILAYSMSEASADNEYMRDIERPNVDIVRQLNYMHRMSDNQSHNVSNIDVNVKLVNISNDISAERINALRRYIASKTVGTCDFTCHKCYRCSLVHGELESDNTEYLFLDE